MMKTNMLVLLLLMAASSSYACEPASVDWENVYQQIDPKIKNLDQAKNIFLSFDEFKKISNLYPYEWPKDQQFQGTDGKRNLFNAIDLNKDQKISRDEIFNIYNYLPNPCAGWPW